MSQSPIFLTFPRGCPTGKITSKGWLANGTTESRGGSSTSDGAPTMARSAESDSTMPHATRESASISNQLPVPGGSLQSLCFRFIARYSGLSSSERSSSSSAFLARPATIPRAQAAETEAEAKSHLREALLAGAAIGAGVEIAMQMATGMAHEHVDDGTLLV